MKAYTEEDKMFRKLGRENARKIENEHHFTKLSYKDYMDFAIDTCAKRFMALAGNWNKTPEEEAEFNLLIWTNDAMNKMYKSATK